MAVQRIERSRCSGRSTIMYLFQFKLANPMNVSDILAADIIHVDVDTVAIDIKRALDLNTITHDHQTESVISLELISIMVGSGHVATLLWSVEWPICKHV